MSDTPQPTEAEREASAWLVMLDSPAVPHADIVRFQTWLAASAENKRAWEGVCETWDQLGGVLAALPANDRAPPPATAASPSHHALPRLDPRLWAPLAASALIGVLLFAPVLQLLPGPAYAQSYATEARALETIALPDGSSVELSPLARLDTNINGDERRVRLRDGTAAFVVTHDPARPFIIETPHGEVRVLGTRFVVRVGNHGATATILEGAVSAIGPEPSSLWGRLTTSRPPLSAGANDEISFTSDGVVVRSLAPTAVASRLAWREGMVSLDNATLADACREVTRFSGIEFGLADRELADIRVSGYFDGADVGAFVTLLTGNFDIIASPPIDGRITLRASPQGV
jgi:transmembrane sensor